MVFSCASSTFKAMCLNVDLTPIFISSQHILAVSFQTITDCLTVIFYFQVRVNIDCFLIYFRMLTEIQVLEQVPKLSLFWVQ